MSAPAPHSAIAFPPRAGLPETRRRLLARLADLSAAAPEMRFGQLVENACLIAAGETGRTQWDVEDGDLLAAVRQMEREHGPARAAETPAAAA